MHFFQASLRLLVVFVNRVHVVVVATVGLHVAVESLLSFKQNAYERASVAVDVTLSADVGVT